MTTSDALANASVFHSENGYVLLLTCVTKLPGTCWSNSAPLTMPYGPCLPHHALWALPPSPPLYPTSTPTTHAQTHLSLDPRLTSLLFLSPLSIFHYIRDILQSIIFQKVQTLEFTIHNCSGSLISPENSAVAREVKSTTSVGFITHINLKNSLWRVCFNLHFKRFDILVEIKRLCCIKYDMGETSDSPWLQKVDTSWPLT